MPKKKRTRKVDDMSERQAKMKSMHASGPKNVPMKKKTKFHYGG